MTSKGFAFPFSTHYDLIEQVRVFCDEPSAYNITEYGAIEDWNVSQVTIMEDLFLGKTDCNPNISAWDVSNVTDFVSYGWSLFDTEKVVGE